MHFDVVVVGGGAGGLELAARLGRKLGSGLGREKVLLVDRAAFHIWKPTLHEVAAGTLDVHQEGLSYMVLARRNHFSFAMGELASLDVERRSLSLSEITDAKGQVVVPARSLSFTWLVLALGSGSNSFNTPGIEHAYLLENVRDAQNFHADWLNACARAAFSPARALGVAIVGGGATGVELSAELIEAHAEMLGSLGREQHFRLDITLVEGGPRILGGLPEKISAQARLALERKQVRVMTGARVAQITRGALHTSEGEIAADLLVWAAGIKAAQSNAGMGLEVNALNQFVVNDRLETSRPHILALGDCAACPWQEGKLVPARAQAAHQQADYLAQVLAARLEEREVAQPFVYRDFGSLVSLGDNKGVGNLMGGLMGRNFFVEGLIAKWMYMSLHLMHHRAILGIGKTAVLALARLLQQRVSGRLKLH
jgi:NADH dehydrogenase